jgi:hypothetical protein
MPANMFDTTTIPLARDDQMMTPVSSNAMKSSSQPGTKQEGIPRFTNDFRNN